MTSDPQLRFAVRVAVVKATTLGVLLAVALLGQALGWWG